MRISTALTVLSLSSVALAVPAIERRSSRAECLADALAKVFPIASAEFYYVTICFIGRSTIDLKDKSMNRWQPWYKHLSTVMCGGEN
ncbi:hypothetical protein PHBOTO_002404 [Pseudozyma hubeiensis]|nr:hypothetical protein PHBOTO_002404 [Pseudozyma hubeiensis]